MKKILAMLLAATLVIGAAVLPALAEETNETADQVSSATAQAGSSGQAGGQLPDRNQNGQMPGSGQMPQAPGRNGNMPANGQAPGNGQAPDRNQNGQTAGNGQMPEIPGQNGSMPANGQAPDRNRNGQTAGNGQMPEVPGQNGSMPANGQAPDRNQNGQTAGNGQMPEVPGQNTPNGRQTLPGNGTRNMKHGNRFGGQGGRTGGMQADRSGKQMIFDRLLAEGVITQEIYDTITSYMKEHAPQQPENSASPAEGSDAPALPDGTTPAEGSEPPALPDGTAPVGETVSPEEQMLKDLLDSGVISQEQYELLLTKITTEGTVPGSAG